MTANPNVSEGVECHFTHSTPSLTFGGSPSFLREPVL